MAFEIHLNEGSKLSSSVIESYPSLTEGSKNFNPAFSNGILWASFPR